MKFKRLKDLREDHDMYQKDIAELLGISQQYYSEYESGNTFISSPLPLNSLITSDDKNLELLPVTYISTLFFLNNPFKIPYILNGSLEFISDLLIANWTSSSKT